MKVSVENIFEFLNSKEQDNEIEFGTLSIVIYDGAYYQATQHYPDGTKNSDYHYDIYETGTREEIAEIIYKDYIEAQQKFTQDKFQEDLKKTNPKDFGSVFGKLFK